MKKKTVNMMKGLGVAMAVGSMVAGTVATMNSIPPRPKRP